MKKAVALKYFNADVPAPVITAKGKGYLADRIIRIAQEKGVTVVENNNLVSALFLADIGNIIPEKHYRAVAEILWFVLKV